MIAEGEAAALPAEDAADVPAPEGEAPEVAETAGETGATDDTASAEPTQD